MEPSVKDKHIILGFVGFAILLISSIATLIVAEKFNQDNFVRLIVFVCSNLLGWLFYFSFQTVIFDTYEIYKIKFGKKKTFAETMTVRGRAAQRYARACNTNIKADRWRSDPGYKTCRDCHSPGTSREKPCRL